MHNTAQNALRFAAGRSAHADAYTPSLLQRAYMPLKRLMDVLLSVPLLVCLSPFLLIITVLIRCESSGSALFCQQRMGRHGKIIRILKFRTMHERAPQNVSTANLVDSDKFITRFGAFLRKTSIDELPQLINVLKGDMSIVGPRPLILNEKEIHALRFAKGVYTLRPGLTGLAQINGRDMITPQQKVAHDVDYLHRFGFFTDISIFFRSVLIVLTRRGVCEGHKPAAEKPAAPGARRENCPMQTAEFSNELFDHSLTYEEAGS